MAKKDSLVFPGSPLTVEEEFAAGKNVFVDDNGNVVANVIGSAEFDENSREAHVQQVGRQVNGLETGAIVYGRVILVKDSVVVVGMALAEKDGKKKRIFDSSATINISRVSSQYVRSLGDFFKIGDYVKARVLDVNSYGVELATNEDGLGVIASRDTIIQKLVAGNEQFAVKKNVEPSRH